MWPNLLWSPFWFTTETLKAVKRRSLNHADGLQQVSGGVEKTIYRGRKIVADCCAPIWKIKLREAAEIRDRGRGRGRMLWRERERERGEAKWISCAAERLDTFYPATGCPKTDSLRRSERIRGWWSRVVWFENQVARTRTCGWVVLEQMVWSVECWKNRWSSKLINSGSWVNNTGAEWEKKPWQKKSLQK